MLPSNIAQKRKAMFDRVIQSGEPVRFEDEREKTWFDNVFFPIMDGQGKVTTVGVLSHDITEQKKLEMNLSISLDFLHIINQHSEMDGMLKELITQVSHP